MNDIPRRRIQPLAPPPGQFEAVLGRARHRRYRRAGAVLTVSAVFLAGVAGGVALDRPVGQLVDLATNGGGEPAVKTEAPSTSAAATPKVGKTKGHKDRGAAIVQSPPPQGALALTGRAVGAAGQVAAGLYVYPGVQGVDGFVPTLRHVTRTDADGTFSMTCPGTPVLLAPWPLNAEAKSKARAATWEATFVGGATDARSASTAPCSRTDRVIETVVQPGSSVSGSVSMPSACEDQALPLWVWLHNDRRLSVRLQALQDGHTFRIGGLPAGEHTLGANGNRTKVSVSRASTVTQDMTFSCQPGSPPDPVETTTPPDPSPTATGSPSPTGSETSDPSSSPSTTSSPDPSSSGGSSPSARP